MAKEKTNDTETHRDLLAKLREAEELREKADEEVKMAFWWEWNWIRKPKR